ncbi:MAG: DnaA/Hda family protein [Candidatus Thermoplasmatota archaeon]|jgi:chromosomal replication initiator protein DnaA|nr:DnaA/Hda family protein [Candidatus Thermoplasmatota archaeon]
MGFLDIFGRKRKGKAVRGERERPQKARPLPDDIEGRTKGQPPTAETEIGRDLKTERAKLQEQERRLMKMEESITRLQEQWLDLLQKQQKAFEAMVDERSMLASESSDRSKVPVQGTAGPMAPEDARDGGRTVTSVSTAVPSNQTLLVPPAGTDRLSAPILKDKTLSNFVVDDSNRFPFLAAEAVASGTGRRYNPLFIFGPVGVGKTHLLQAIANRMLEREPGLRVLYTSTEKLTDELIRVLEAGDIGVFRNRYDEMDVLLIDDIQLLSGKEKTQTEFFHMFNHLYNSQKQIVLCSDRPPSEIQELETRLRSRFEGGLIIDIKVPTFEGRKQILVNLAQKEGFSISVEVLDYLAFYLDSNVRELQGGFNRVTAFASLMKEPITVNLVMKVLDSLIQKKEVGIREQRNAPLPKVEFPHDEDMRRTAQSELELEQEADRLEIELLQEIRKSSTPNSKVQPRSS